ncbi:MAG: hypothetical protein OXF01_10660 [Gemmatimonadetes bacterium]|nr:hypothetical protein [Gemmatimonadota bacterium]
METRNARFAKVLLALLLVAIGVQGALLLSRTLPESDAAAPVPALGVGDTVYALAGETAAGSTTVIPLVTGTGSATVLYAFHPECAYCDSIAPAWSRYAASDVVGGASVRRVAVTMDLPEPALAYAAHFGWKMDVLSMSRLTPADRDYSLLAKTPWIFVFDSSGVLRFQTHGTDLNLAEDAVQRLGGAP